MEHEYKKFNKPATICRKNTACLRAPNGRAVAGFLKHISYTRKGFFIHLNGKIMKKIVLGLCVLSATTWMCASAHASDNVTVPLKVRAEFRHEYKHVSNVDWTVKDGRYCVSFVDGKANLMARYDGTGHRIDTRESISRNAMPEKAVSHLEEKYHGAYTHTYTRIHRPWKKDLYMVKVKNKGKDVPVYVDKDGREHDYASR